MKQNFLHFLSDVPCNLECNGQSVGFIDNTNTSEIDLLTNTEHIFINYIPISQSNQSIPYTFKLNTNEEVDTDNKYIKVVPFPNNHYDIIMKPFYYYQVTDTQVLYNGNIDKYFISITNSNITNITIISGNMVVFNKNINKITNVKVEKNNDIIIITGIIDETNYQLLLIDTQNFDLIYNETIQSIEEGLDTINTYKKINSLCQHAVVCKLDLKSKQSQKYYVYDYNKQEQNIPTILIPQAFLENLVVNDENMIKNMVNTNFQNTPLPQFKDYFGNVQEIYLNRHQTDTNKINYTIFSDKYHNFNFLMDNNRIYDIEEIF